MTESLTIAAPFSGTVVAMSHVPDEVFAQSIVGPGVALEPPAEPLIHVAAPIAGTVTALFPHAFSIRSEDGRDVLVHLGIDTVTLKGDGFSVHTNVGATVKVGDVLTVWDPQPAREAGLSVLCPIVAVQGDSADLRVLVSESVQVESGAELARWTGQPS